MSSGKKRNSHPQRCEPSLTSPLFARIPLLISHCLRDNVTFLKWLLPFPPSAPVISAIGACTCAHTHTHTHKHVGVCAHMSLSPPETCAHTLSSCVFWSQMPSASPRQNPCVPLTSIAFLIHSAFMGLKNKQKQKNLFLNHRLKREIQGFCCHGSTLKGDNISTPCPQIVKGKNILYPSWHFHLGWLICRQVSHLKVVSRFSQWSREEGWVVQVQTKSEWINRVVMLKEVGRNPEGGNWGSGILASNEIWARGNCTGCAECRESHGVKKEAQGIHLNCLRFGLLKETHATWPLYLEPPPDMYWTKGRQLGSVTQREKELPASFVVGGRVGELNGNLPAFREEHVCQLLPWDGKVVHYQVVQVGYCCSVAKLCSALCEPMGCSLPGSSVHGISQARILEWVAISFSRGSFQPRDWTHVSCIGRWILYYWASREAPQVGWDHH